MLFTTGILLATASGTAITAETIITAVVGVGGLLFSLETYQRVKKQSQEQDVAEETELHQSIANLSKRLEIIANNIDELAKDHHEVRVVIGELRGEFRAWKEFQLSKMGQSRE